MGTKQKKANSLPRSGSSIPEPRLRKSSSQVFSPSKVSSSKPLGQLSAYERLFGVPSPSSSRCTSPVVKKTGVPMIIPKVRRGSGERPTALGRLSSSPARSHEKLLPPCTSEEKKKEKISLHSIDGLLSAPDKIEIPSRYQPEVEKTLMSLTEQESRSAKVTSIKKMLVETGASCTLGNQDNRLPTESGEKRAREKMLDLNQVLARQVAERTKQIAASTAPEQKEDQEKTSPGSPEVALPLRQQRETFLC